ncbi:hypothetical protein A2U01_0086190, partial [Trifolium medium]|nr:hypothetical protein [Trifolium medium]
ALIAKLLIWKVTDRNLPRPTTPAKIVNEDTANQGEILGVQNDDAMTVAEIVVKDAQAIKDTVSSSAVAAADGADKASAWETSFD